MTKVKEIREMADEQIRLVWKDAAETLFRLRLQAQTEKLAAPSEVKKQRRTIARCQTILTQRGVPLVTADAAGHEPPTRPSRRGGRTKVRAAGKGGAARPTSRKRPQGGK
jgi:large subunit ribosomal protein L29